MAKFQIRKQINNYYRFILKAENGQTILTSVSYSTVDKCLIGIESLRQNVMDKNRYEFRKSFHLKHYFNVMDAEGLIIGSSEMYESSSGRDVGIALLKMNVPDAVIENLT